MKFLADENVEKPIVDWLRMNGYDVLYISEFMGRSIDEELLDRANQESRVLITNDKDFGELIFLQGKSSKGILLMRFSTEKTATKVKYLANFITTFGKQLEGSFATINENTFRIRKLRALGMK